MQASTQSTDFGLRKISAGQEINFPAQPELVDKEPVPQQKELN